MSAKTQVFITGATGYVAGCVIDRLVHHHTFATSEYTALIREADKVAAFESLGIKTIVGSYDNHALLEKQSSESDIIFACADSDNAGACAAILRGLKKRHEATGKVPTLIHTSGSAIILDNAQGNFATEEVWDDTDVAKLDTIPDTQLHRNVDTLILAADKEGYVKSYLVIPSTVYGVASGKLVDLGVQNPRSIQLPLAVRVSIERKQAGYVGKGLNMWPDVHVDDIADLYIVLYDAILEGKAGHGREGLYFGENGHHVLKDVATKIGEGLYDQGASETSEPNAFTEEDYKKYPMLPLLLGTNCRIKATRARALGWKPKHATDEMFESLKEEVEWQLKLASKA